MSAQVLGPEGLELPNTLRRSLPSEILPATWTYESAHAYCRHLAKTHYENFHVGTWLFPKAAREHAFNFYAYCRWSDDLADETGDPAMSLRLLEWWRGELDATFEGRPAHPVFVALAKTIETYDLEKKPFADLLDAFVQDQTVFRYETMEQVLDYCKRSANPVGRVVLALLGYRDEERRRLSDKTCSALQLANHWQDIENDLRRGRIYVPLEHMDRFKVNEEDLAMPTANDAVRDLVEFEVRHARAMFHEGLPLVDMVEGRARFDIELFSRGGLAILDAIEAQGFDVLRRRPAVGKFAKSKLLIGSLARGLLGRRDRGQRA